MHARQRRSLPGPGPWIARSLAAAVIATTVLACGPGSADGATEVAAGTLDGQAWSARAGLAGASGVCLEVHLESVAPNNRLCGLQGGESGLWRFDVGSGTFVAGTRSDAAATSVRVTLADGSQVSASLTEARDVAGLRFFVLVVPLGSPLERIDTLDEAGEVLDSLPLGDDVPIKEPPGQRG
ncbi:MAG: hypothetical protein L0227_08525 [Chloroflexi bacterium]|nr:hypothetical protein [Chloroflexota bacterium]